MGARELARAKGLVDRAPSGWRGPLAAWLDSLHGVEWRSAHTVVAYIGDLVQLADHVQGTVEGVNRSALRSWLAELRSAGAATATMQRKVAAARVFYRFAARAGWVDSDPTALVGAPKVDSLLPRVPTQAQTRAMLDACNEATVAGMGTKLLVELLYSVGLRCGEAVSVTVGDVDLARREVRVLGKGDRERVVPFAQATAQTIGRCLASRRPQPADTDPLLVNRYGHPLSARQARYRVAGLAERVGAPKVSTHSLRHGYATHLLEGGAGLRDIQELLGHAELKTTMRYTRVTTELVRSVYEGAHPRA